jgi:hypothetical protein
MSFNRQMRGEPASLQCEICRADAPTVELISALLDLACARRALPAGARQANRIRELIESQAWTDAALALVALDRTRIVRRLIRDETEWRCTLGSQWPVPDWLDDPVEFGHPVLPLAILGALAESLRESPAASTAATSVPPSRSGLHDANASVDCGNFA